MINAAYIDEFTRFFAGMPETQRLKILKCLEGLHTCEESHLHDRIVVNEKNGIYKAVYFDSNIKGVGLGFDQASAMVSLKRIRSYENKK